MLLDRSGPDPKVLLGRRHDSLVFMPGIYVCPGGKVERADANVPAIGDLPAHVARRLSDGRLPAKTYALTAVRELFEETGLMLGRKGPVPDGLNGEWRGFAEAGVAPCLNDIWFIARSVTPPGFVRRYDTRFFAADAGGICHTIDGVVNADAELVELAWIPVGDTAGLKMHMITRLVLGELAARLETGLDRDLPVPYFRARNGVMRRLEI